jgi:hypothetical protein
MAPKGCLLSHGPFWAWSLGPTWVFPFSFCNEFSSLIKKKKKKFCSHKPKVVWKGGISDFSEKENDCFSLASHIDR